MTLVCCWFDDSYGRKRITLLADSRITFEGPPGTVHVINETTIKLFRIQVSCFGPENMNPLTGAYAEPYFTTDVGLGFAGYCTEALTIIATVARCLEGLVSHSEEKPPPSPCGIVHLIESIIGRYFRNHTRPSDQSVDLFVCGHSEGAHWLAKVSHRSKLGVSVDWLPLGPNDFHVIGNIISTDPKYQASVDELKARIAKHKAELRNISGTIDGYFDWELEAARHDVAKKKAIEKETLKRLFSPFVQGVGGVLQKMEVYGNGTAARAVFTKDDRPYLLDGLPIVGGNSLGVIPIVEGMG